ncbi:MAG: hypothetical protein QOJ31_256 [Gaiellales bacterium]|jgi:hypothetical protein|nr:hypothetical protein [Gaiellales bacterium]MDX6544972.1 hypothetical protein [Gaiellales bacterium]MDX6549572.1 hypothetical protein [Gaiellales bacterium]
MQITVACHECDQPKRPLSPCPSCGALALAEPELQAWRLSLHARHLARIKATPERGLPGVRAPRDLSPMSVTLTLDLDLDLDAEFEHATMDNVRPIQFESQPLDPALEFDWDDEPRRARRAG